MSVLMLESITRDEDPRGITLVLSLHGERFTDHYLDMNGKFAPSMRSPMSFTREELVVHDLVGRWRAGEPVNLPAPIVAPPAESLSPQDQRRAVYVDSPFVQAQIERIRAACAAA